MATIVKVELETNLAGVFEQKLEPTGLTIKAKFYDTKTGESRAPQPPTNIFCLNKDTKRAEFVLVDSISGPDADGVYTLTVNSSGRALNLYGALAGAATGNTHFKGDSIGCVTNHIGVSELNDWASGNSSSGSNSLRVGDETDSDIRYYAQNADASKPYLGYDSATSQWVFSNDGASEGVVGGSTASYTAGDGIDISAGVISVDVTDFISLGDGLSEDASNNIQVNLDTDPGLEFNSGALRVKTKTGGGITRDSDGLSVTEPLPTNVSPRAYGVAYESISQGDAVCRLPIQLDWSDILDESGDSVALGDANARRRHALKFTATANGTITDRNLRLKKTGSATQTITVSLQADSSGEPSGTALVSDTLAASTLTTSFATKNFDFGAGQAVVKGTDYWVVIEVDATDGSNYVDIQTADTWYTYFPEFERQTYDLDTTSWGGSTTSAPFWCWGDETFGEGIFKTDRDILSKVWTFEGFAAAAASAGDDVSIAYFASENVLGVTIEAGKTYYLSSTAGQITATPDDLNLATLHAPFSSSPAPAHIPVVNYRVAVGTRDSDGDLIVKVELGEKMIVDYISDTYSGGGSNDGRILTWLPSSYWTSQFQMGDGTAASLGFSFAGNNGTSDSIALYHEASGNGTDTGQLGRQITLTDITDRGYLVSVASHSTNIDRILFTIRQH